MLQTTLSAVAITFIKTSVGCEVLHLRVYKYWDFPKGMVEEGEDPWSAAIRELEEETGLSKFSIPFKKVFFETKPYAKGKVARYYIVVIDEDKDIVFLPNPITGIIEHHEFRWLHISEARNLLVPRVREVLDWATEVTHT
jgi:bis(5'-nucleosidyl)-tetraphosphatase